ncbi:MAG: hypothetical protein JO061_22230 [Acidobacteriaceae bacterium]|nr:hypothetical protein [Acidobacteriaceae bacterium]
MPAWSDTAYFERTFFDNSETPDAYFHSAGRALEPSTLDLIGEKLPVETKTVFSPPNAIRLEWTSRANGGWEGELDLYEWRNRDVYFPGDVLSFYAYAPAAISSADLPLIELRDKRRGFTHPIELSRYLDGIAAKRWTEVRIPMSAFSTASIHHFEAHRVNSICFSQGAADGAPHTLILDEIRFDSKAALDANSHLRPPEDLKARGFERHIDLSWRPAAGPEPERYVVYRSSNGEPYRPVGIQVRGIHRFEDWLGEINRKASYKVRAVDRGWHESAFSSEVQAETHAMTDDELLTMVEEASFRYYWEGAHPVAGMTLENIPGDDRIVALGASGFGIMALVVGVDRGFITRAQGVERMLKITAFLERADRYHGAWPHFLDGATGRRMPVFDMFDNGADLVETSFLMEGLLTARQYFKDNQDLYTRVTRLWETVEWDWFRRSADGPALFWHWSPEYTWYINHRLYGWNEVMITYLLAIASKTHGVAPGLYYTGWAGDPKEFINGHTHFGIKLDLGSGTGGPLFFTHYSYMGFDPHGIHDRFTNYFENNGNMARINGAYCAENPNHFKAYGRDLWGITAVDGPQGYVPYEPTPSMDDGTIAPTGALSSFPYTPEASLRALKYFYRELGDRLWDVYGFRDAVNVQQNWFARINMGLNQAPITVMIENYRTGLVWKNFMANPEIGSMVERVGLR